MLRAAAIAERAGVPSVSIVTTPFIQQAAVVSKGVGLPSLPIAEYPGVPMTDGSDAVARKIDALLPQIVAGLAGARDVARTAVAEPGPRDIVARGTLDEVQELYHRNLWSDGLPAEAAPRSDCRLWRICEPSGRGYCCHRLLTVASNMPRVKC